MMNLLLLYALLREDRSIRKSSASLLRGSAFG